MLTSTTTSRLLRRSLRLVHTCPSCAQPLSSPLPACTNCWMIGKLPSNQDYHSLFDIPNQESIMRLNQSKLRGTFLRAQMTCHPDAWASKGPDKHDTAQQLSTHLNQAYKKLLDPVSRAEYVLELNGHPITEEDQVTDMEFISEIMQAREEIEDAQLEDTESLMRIRSDNSDRMEKTVQEIAELVAAQNWVTTKQSTIKLKYLQGIESATKNALDNK